MLVCFNGLSSCQDEENPRRCPQDHLPRTCLPFSETPGIESLAETERCTKSDAEEEGKCQRETGSRWRLEQSSLRAVETGSDEMTARRAEVWETTSAGP